MFSKTLSAVLLSSLSLFVGAQEITDLVEGNLDTGFDEGFGSLYRAHCAICHGDEMQGTAQGSALIGVDLQRGSEVESLRTSISKGAPDKGMPAWASVLSSQEIQNLSIYIAEQRENLTYLSFHDLAKLNVSSDAVDTQLHVIGMKVIARDLDPLVYSIEPLPDGRILVSERTLGLSILEPGKPNVRVQGLPTFYTDLQVPGLAGAGLGQLLDVKAHPEYLENGWIYLTYGDRCSDCNEQSRALEMDVSMVRVIRGRLRGADWIDEEEIWSVDKKFYTIVPDAPAAARLTFDERDHLFVSIGMQSVPMQSGVQDLGQPYGKIHRVRSDGQIPIDNPYRENPDAMATVWSLGHRTPQGLEFDSARQVLWETEMGPRGGDEVNLIEPGSNYGWPLVSNGVNYDGTKVNFGLQFGIEFDLEDLVGPELDFTPAPAVSSFIVYGGDAFQQWRGDLIVATLKAQKLMRVRPTEAQDYEVETLIEDIARIRDIEEDREGNVLLLLEHLSGSVVVELSPVVGKENINEAGE